MFWTCAFSSRSFSMSSRMSLRPFELVVRRRLDDALRAPEPIGDAVDAVCPVQLGFEHSERVAQACDGVVVLVAVELHRTQSGRTGLGTFAWHVPECGR